MPPRARINLAFLDDSPPPAEPWNAAEALRLESAADELIEKLGVSGTHPEIAAAAERGVRAHHRHDLAGVRSAVAEVETIARKLAEGRSG